MRRTLMAVVALAALITAGLAGGPILERNRFDKEISLLQGALHHARFSVDSCKMSLAQEEQRFLFFDEAVDSLHARVRSFEDPSQGGVPEALYPEYLEVFDRYNDSVAVWDARAGALQASEASCRGLVEKHNALGDSLRRLSGLGPTRDTLPPPPAPR